MIEKFNVYSQNGEDGIISHLLSKIGDVNLSKWCCEFGAHNGTFLSNTFNLVKNSSYRAVYIEADKEKFKDLEKTAESYPQITAINSFVGVEDHNRIDNILSKTEIPLDFDVLSIDVDGIDCLILDSMKKFRPKIIVIEINSGKDPERVMSAEELDVTNMMSHTYEGSMTSGCNFMTCYKIAANKNYRLVAHTGNLIFIDEKYSSIVNVATDENCLDYFDRRWLT